MFDAGVAATVSISFAAAQVRFSLSVVGTDGSLEVWLGKLHQPPPPTPCITVLTALGLLWTFPAGQSPLFPTAGNCRCSLQWRTFDISLLVAVNAQEVTLSLSRGQPQCRARRHL